MSGRTKLERRARATTQALARLMEAKLLEYKDRGDWAGLKPAFLLRRLDEEVRELRAAVADLSREDASPGRGIWRRNALATEVALEAADVANMAMMIADVCGGLAAGSSGESGGTP